MNLFENKIDCCGCWACVNICPRKAIVMLEDEEGFFYPKIDEEKCINCDLCKKVCFYKNGYANIADHVESKQVYALKHRNLRVRQESQSGGAFTALSDIILDNEGVVYGVGFAENFTVLHKRAVTKITRDEFRGSKYIQSRVGEILKNVKDDLDADKLVMFTGTPCQVEGLKQYLGSHKNIANLYLVDLICYNSSSPKIWKEYLSFLEQRDSENIVSVKFRDKKFGWRTCIETIQYKKNIRNYDNFARLFGSRLIARPSCYSCKFTNTNRCSDITIGDYWGIEKSIPNFEDSLGVSLVLINNSRGI